MLIAPAVRTLLADKLRAYEEKGQVGRVLRVMVLGIPNVGKSTFINRILGRKSAKAADTVYLATDPDREGEAISWHLKSLLDLPDKKTKRVTFNEITKNVVRQSIENPRDIDQNLVDAQQARRILDRLVGYQLSPLLWKKIKRGLSAGRVQSVATRMVDDREREIENFKPEEYWTLDVHLQNHAAAPFTAHYYGVDGKKYEQRRSQYAEFRAASDKLCREYGLSVVEQPKAKEPARYARMREAIDQACEDASTAEDFHRALYRQGYIFGSDPNRRYATIRARDGGRAVRLYRLGEEHDLAAIDDRLRGNYLLYGPRLYERKHPPRQYTPKRYRPKDGCAGKGILRIFFEVFFGESQMHRLYLYYCYQLGILPKKQQPRINRPELERIWKDTERILAEHAFVHDHKFPSLQAIVDYRKGLSRQIDALAAQRAEIVKQMRRKDAPPELADRRAMLTCKIAELRKEDKIAEGAIKRIQRTRESNRIDQENRNQHTNNKTRSRDRSRQR